MNRKYCIDYFFTSVANPPEFSKLLNLGEVLLWGIIFYIVCADGSDINRQKFCRYGLDNLFRKSSVVKEYRDENLVVSDRNKLAIDIFREKAKI